MRRWIAAACLAFALLAPAAQALAAELRWRGPADCADRERVLARIERLVGRPLADVHGVDFEVELSRRIGEEWIVVVRALPRATSAGEPGETSAPRSREIAATSCAEAADTAAVAVAMAALEQEGRAEQAGPDPASAGAAAAPAARTAASAEVPPARAAGVAPPDDDDASDADATWRFGIAAGGSLDAGALPSPALGAQLELFAGYGALRIAVLGTLFAAQRTRLADGARGGEFELMLGGLLACADPARARLRALGCLGFEVGELRGVGIASDPREGAAGWRALRADGGVLWRVGSGFALVARIGLSVALARPPFVIDGSDQVHRPSRLGARGLIGLELAL
jgi:hypothetical protein